MSTQRHPDRVMVQKWFGNLPIVEAKKDLRIQPNPQDIKNAVKGDPQKCIFSKACQRMWGSNSVLFFGTRAYVDLLDKNGKRRVERFRISTEGQRMIKAFDAGKKVTPKGFELQAITPGDTAAALRERARAQYKRKPRTNKDGSRPKRKPTNTRFTVFRAKASAQ